MSDPPTQEDTMIRKAIAGLTAAAALAAPLALAAPATADASKPSIADVLLSDVAGDDSNGFDKNWYDFDIVTQAVLLYPDLVAAASDDKASLTVFAPNDRAFQLLVWDITKKWPRSEKAVFDAVASLGLDTVKTVLTYHIVPASIPSSAALKADGAKLPTLQGNTIKVDVISKRAKLIRLKDKDRNDVDPWIVRSKFDVGGTLSNGYIHGISLVLRPTNL